MTELKPCPFCGGEVEIETESYFGIIVFCANCDVYSNDNEDEKEAKIKWNKRISPWKTIEEEIPKDNEDIIVKPIRFDSVTVGYIENNTLHCDQISTAFYINEIEKWMPIPE